MSELTVDITASLDGYVAGPRPSLEDPLGVGGERLHEWLFNLASFRKAHGMEGGVDNEDSAVAADMANAGATIMGRKMFSGGSGSWEDDPNASGWWGDEPPFHHPVFVLTHHKRDDLVLGDSRFVFVTDGIESALAQARTAAGERTVAIGGGASVIQQYLQAGLVDELRLHLVPLLLGDGTRLFDGLGPELRLTRTVSSDAVTHLTCEGELRWAIWSSPSSSRSTASWRIPAARRRRPSRAAAGRSSSTAGRTETRSSSTS
jgi:dihydrofolate reductase